LLYLKASVEQLNNYASQVAAVINSRVMFAQQFHIQVLKHRFHPSGQRLHLVNSVRMVEVNFNLTLLNQVSRKHLFQVDPSLHEIGNSDIFARSLFLQVIAIKVTTRHEDKFRFEDAKILQERLNVLNGFRQFNSIVNLFLCDPGQLGAKRG